MQLINSSGTVTKAYDYDAYGNELTRDLNDPNPFHYCGEYYDIETGFIYLRARYYDPSTGRFISQDTHWNVKNMIYGDKPDEDNPIPDVAAILQSTNLYAYCMNNPVNYIDYTGNIAIIDDLTLLMCAIIVLCAATVTINSTIPLINDIPHSIPSLKGRHAFPYDYTISEPKVEVKTKAETITIADAKEKSNSKNEIVIFRFGYDEKGAAALVPTKKDCKSNSGLSFLLFPRIGAAMTTIDEVNRTICLRAVQDGPNHVSVRPTDGTLEEWHNQGVKSKWTQALLAIVKRVVLK